jgi:hypothetical protein
LNPIPSGVSTTSTILRSSQMGDLAGQTISPDKQTLKVSPVFNSSLRDNR